MLTTNAECHEQVDDVISCEQCGRLLQGAMMHELPNGQLIRMRVALRSLIKKIRPSDEVSIF